MNNNGIDLIVGLGNPGQQYEHTRHNAGAWYVEQLAREYDITLREEVRHKCLTGKTLVNRHEVRLLIPTVFMNLSGQSVAPIANFFKIPPERILVAHDELDLPPGTAKLKRGGGHGGHNGLRDIISKMGNNRDFNRLRIGIGHPGSSDQVTGYVLGRAPQGEQQLIDQAIDKAASITSRLLAGETQKAMNELHGFKATA